MDKARMDGADEFVVFSRIAPLNALAPTIAAFLVQFTRISIDLLFSTVLGA